MPASASRPANTDTQAAAPPDSASMPLAACSAVKTAVRSTLMPSCERARTALNSGSPLRRRYRQLNVDVRPPSRDQARLRDHFRNVVGKYFKGNVAVGNSGNEFARVRRIVGDLRCFEQRRIGSKAPDPSLRCHVPDLGLVGAVREQLDPKLFERGGHAIVLPGGKSDVKRLPINRWQTWRASNVRLGGNVLFVIIGSYRRTAGTCCGFGKVRYRHAPPNRPTTPP